MMKKTEDAEKVADEIAGVDEENPASKKRSCIKCKIELASDNKLPFCPACWEANYRLPEKDRNRHGNFDGRFDKKVWSQSRQGGLHGDQGNIKEVIIYALIEMP